MIKANELRIKNLVTLSEKQRKELWYDQINAYNEFFEVKTIYSDNDISIEVDDEIIDISENDVEPIPLTEEWLFKLGFLKYKGDNKDFWLNDFEFANDLKWIFWRGNILENIKYVHQLQNLYFCLTGAELTVA